MMSLSAIGDRHGFDLVAGSATAASADKVSISRSAASTSARTCMVISYAIAFRSGADGDRAAVVCKSEGSRENRQVGGAMAGLEYPMLKPFSVLDVVALAGFVGAWIVYA